jgi:hypothetical protein
MATKISTFKCRVRLHYPVILSAAKNLCVPQPTTQRFFAALRMTHFQRLSKIVFINVLFGEDQNIAEQDVIVNNFSVT